QHRFGQPPLPPFSNRGAGEVYEVPRTAPPGTLSRPITLQFDGVGASSNEYLPLRELLQARMDPQDGRLHVRRNRHSSVGHCLEEAARVRKPVTVPCEYAALLPLGGVLGAVAGGQLETVDRDSFTT